MENYIDPADFDITEAAFGKCYATTIGQQFAEGFLTGDAITAANVYLTVVAETKFKNTLFVAMPSEAAITRCLRCSCPCNRTSRVTSATATRW